MADVSSDIPLRCKLVDARQLICQGAQSARLDRRFIEEAGVEITDLLRVRSGGSVGLGRFFEDVVQIALRAVFQQGERSVIGAIGRNRGVRQPLAIPVTIEVILRSHGLVEVLRAHA